MHNSSKSLPAGRQGEIALTLTLISLGLMLIGTMLGGLQTSQTLRGHAASCEYNTVGSVWYQKNGDERSYALTKALNGNRHMFVTNNAGQRGEIDDTFGQYGYHPDNFPVITPYYDSVTLNNLDDTQWVVKKISCDPINGNPPGKGCPFNGERDGGKTISNFLVTCGENASYGWLVEHPSTPAALSPTPFTSITPTTAPTSSPVACSFHTHAEVLKYDPERPNFPSKLKLDQSWTTSDFGVSNNRQYSQEPNAPAGRFGTQNVNGKISLYSTFIEYKYETEKQTDLFNPAAVTLVGFNTTLNVHNDWRIKSTFCYGKPGKDGRPSKGCPSTTDQGSTPIIRGFTPDCDEDIYYGWVVESLHPTPNTTPIVAPSTYPTKFQPPTPTEVIPTALPTRGVSIPPPAPTGRRNALKHIDLPVSQDAYIASGVNWRSKKLGTEPNIFIGYEPPIRQVMRALLQFDTSKLKGINIKHAVLNLHFGFCSVQPDLLISMHQINQRWTEESVTWNSGITFNAQKISEINSTCTMGGDMNWDFNTSLLIGTVQNWIDNPLENNGIILKIVDQNTSVIDSNVRAFTSKEGEANGQDFGKLPTLSIDYEGTIAAPTPIPTLPPFANKSALARKDINNDGRINIVDFVLELKELGKKGKNLAADLNNDGVVNMLDVAAVIANFGKSTY